MDIEAPTIKVENGSFFVSANFSSAGERKTLWFSAPEKYAEHFMPDRLDAFLVGLLPVAMKQGENIRLKGEVSEKLLYNINSYLIPILGKVTPDFRKISVTADRTSNKIIENGVQGGGATGFSGGVDSFCAIVEHLHLPATPSHELKHLLFNNVGAVSSNVFIEKYNLLKSIEDDLGIDFIIINSNLNSFIEIPFHLTHSLRNASCALFLQSLFRHYYYASGYAYENIRLAKSTDISSTDAVALHLLSTENLNIITSGGQYSRVEKTDIISDLAIAKDMLNVCIAPNRIDNCSVCWKCCRTLFTLELLGKDQEFKNVFDMEKWKHARSWYVSEFILNPKKKTFPTTMEIKELARRKNHRFTAKEKIMGYVAAWTPQDVWDRMKSR